MSVLICVEGGGETNATSVIFRNNFARFFAKALPNHEQPRIQACGGRDDTISTFNQAVRNRAADVVLLLLDSDEAVPEGMSAKEYLRQKLTSLPASADNDQVHLMVQGMETWLLADDEALAEFYGPAIKNSKSLPKAAFEQISSPDKRLRRVAKSVGKDYLKRDGFFLIGMINPEIVRRRCQHCNRLLEKLERELKRRKLGQIEHKLLG